MHKTHNNAALKSGFSNVCDKTQEIIYSAASAAEDFCLTLALYKYAYSVNVWKRM